MGWLKALGVALFALLAPVHATMAVALALTVIDAITGILAARKRNEAITSAGLRRTVTKLAVYQIGIICAFLVKHYLMDDALPIVSLLASAIGMVELKSILENLDTLNGSPLLATIVAKLGSTNDKT